MLLPFWDRSGNIHDLDPPPQSYHDWTKGEEISDDHKDLHVAAQEHFGSNLVRTTCKAIYMNITLDGTLENGTSIILRQRHSHLSDPAMEEWSTLKFRHEIRLLQWLRAYSSLPVPSLLAIGNEYTIQEKLPGSTLTYHWHYLSGAAKGHFISEYVNVLSELSKLPVPQRIGSAAFDDKSERNILTVGPLLAANPDYSSPRVIDNLSDYIRFLFSVKSRALEKMEPVDSQRAETTLSAIERKITAIVQDIREPSMLRCVLTHADPHGYNFLIDDEGNITGVLDWEFTYIQPAILAVEFPIWLSSEGKFDPRFASDSQWWEESPTERQRLCALFETTLKNRNSELYDCFIRGRVLRAVVGWLLDTLPDPGLGRMGAWAAANFE